MFPLFPLSELRVGTTYTLGKPRRYWLPVACSHCSHRFEAQRGKRFDAKRQKAHEKQCFKSLKGLHPAKNKNSKTCDRKNLRNRTVLEGGRPEIQPPPPLVPRPPRLGVAFTCRDAAARRCSSPRHRRGAGKGDARACRPVADRHAPHSGHQRGRAGAGGHRFGMKVRGLFHAAQIAF